MENQVVFIYCLADSVLTSLNIHDDFQCVMSSAEIVTFVLISTLFYQCNYRLTRHIVKHQNYFPTLLSRSRLIRRIHQIPEIVWLIIFTVCRDFLCQKKSRNFIVDSFPVSACQNNKIFRCKLFTHKAYRGYTASKKTYFFGIKVHMIVNLEGVPIEFHFSPGSTSDIKGLKCFFFNLDEGAKIFADRAYNDYNFEDLLSESANIKLIPKRKLNSKRKNSGTDEFFLSLFRNRIETTFSSIASLMPRYIKAKTAKGFLLKTLFFILGYMIKRLHKTS